MPRSWCGVPYVTVLVVVGHHECMVKDVENPALMVEAYMQEMRIEPVENFQITIKHLRISLEAFGVENSTATSSGDGGFEPFVLASGEDYER